jgi:hypothetical protein
MDAQRTDALVARDTVGIGNIRPLVRSAFILRMEARVAWEVQMAMPRKPARSRRLSTHFLPGFSSKELHLQAALLLA